MISSTEQAEIVGTIVQRFAVRAAAGSGKTSVLVDRYIRHVVDLGFSPDEIVTLTFTRKAASVMKRRIVERLRDLGRTDDAQAAETGPIQTIHSFCERILRENAVEALIDPEFEVLDGPNKHALFDRAITNAFLASRSESRSAADFVHRYSGRHSFTSTATSHGRLREAVLRTLEKFRASGLQSADLRPVYASPETAIIFWAQQATRDLPEAVLSSSEAALEPAWGRNLTERLKLLGSRPPPWLKSQSHESDLVSAEDTCGLVWLALTAWDWLEGEMTIVQQFDFALLESKAVRLMEDSLLACERLRKQCKIVLVDEAQDLNPLQYRIIDQLQASGEMMVGDPQQSIYGFRFADRGLFMGRCGLVDTFELTKNYRSESGILDFIDAVFSSTWGSEHTPMTLPEEVTDDPFGSSRVPHFEGVELWPLAAKDTASIALLTHQMVQEGTNPKDIAILARSNSVVNLIAARLKSLGVPCRTVGASEKFYTRLEVRDLANALEALCDPYDDFPLLALLRSPFVGLSLDAVTYLASRSPVIEALAEPGPWGGDDQRTLDDFRLWFERIKEVVDRVPAWETLTSLMRDTQYLIRIAALPSAEQTLANVRKLFTMAASEPELNAREFALRTREIQFLRHKEGDALTIDDSESAVTIMTVHKSKGLEFDVVVLPETHSRLSRRRSDIAIDATRGLVVTGMRKPSSAFHIWLSDQQIAKDREEELRVLYVGMTRARKRLCVVVNEEGGHESAASILALRSGMPKNVLPGLKVRRLNDTP